MGEQLAAGLYVGLWESPGPASHSLSKAGIISACGDILSGTSLPAWWGQGASAEVLLPSPGLTGPLARKGPLSGPPDPHSLPQPSSCLAPNHPPPKVGLWGNPTHLAPVGLSFLMGQAPGPLGVTAPSHPTPTAGLTQGRPRAVVGGLAGRAGCAHVAPTACVRAEQDAHSLDYLKS